MADIAIEAAELRVRRRIGEGDGQRLADGEDAVIRRFDGAGGAVRFRCRDNDLAVDAVALLLRAILPICHPPRWRKVDDVAVK
jgi:hypothetical protein